MAEQIYTHPYLSKNPELERQLREAAVDPATTKPLRLIIQALLEL